MEFTFPDIDGIIKLKTMKGRESWKCLPMTDRQRKILGPYVHSDDKEKFKKIDRGGAWVLIKVLFIKKKEWQIQGWAS